MAYKRRTRNPAQRVHRRFHERLNTLQTKVKELNAISEGRAAIISIYKGKRLGFGDEELLKGFHPTLSPTDSTSSLDGQSETHLSKNLFKEVEGSVNNQPSVPSEDGKGFKLKTWRKEDLELLAFDFFGDD